MATNESLRLGVIGTGHMATEYARSWVSIEKPMVTTVAEAQRLISARDQSRSTIVIAFQGALLTLNAAGDGPPGCASHITFFYTRAIVRIDAWGAWREIAAAGIPGFREEVEITDNPLKSFLAIRAGRAENLSTVEAGLRFARLWDAVKASAARGGEPVAVHLGPMTPRL
jgi:hypothetical protein